MLTVNDASVGQVRHCTSVWGDTNCNSCKMEWVFMNTWSTFIGMKFVLFSFCIALWRSIIAIVLTDYSSLGYGRQEYVTGLVCYNLHVASCQNCPSNIKPLSSFWVSSGEVRRGSDLVRSMSVLVCDLLFGDGLGVDLMEFSIFCWWLQIIVLGLHGDGKELGILIMMRYGGLWLMVTKLRTFLNLSSFCQTKRFFQFLTCKLIYFVFW